MNAFSQARKEYVYYGDTSNRFLRKLGLRPDSGDLNDRKKTLKALMEYGREDFNRKVYKEDAHGRPVGASLSP